MRLFLLSAWFPYPPDNGSKIRVYHLLRALGRRHQVTLVSFAFDTARPEQASAALPFCHKVYSVRRSPFQRSSFVLAARYLSFAPVVTRPVLEVQRLVEHVSARNSFDVVVASTAMMGTYAFQGSVPSIRILEAHNSWSRLMEDRYRAAHQSLTRLSHWVSWQKARYYEAALFRRFDRVIVVSQEDRRACERLPRYSGPVEVVDNGVDCTYHRPGLAHARPHSLVYNGALTYDANYDAMAYFLAHIYPQIRRQVPDVSLTITGTTQGVDLADLPLDDSVRFSGYVDDVRPLVAGSAACVAPLRQGGGTRIKILEAMALGTPVVSTSKGAEGLEVVPGEHLLLADRPAAFAEATVRLLRSQSLRQRLAANARRRVEERYDWTHIGQRFVQLVEDAVACRRRHG
jgi:glycosyltransferase involved in cell wall biosynthesis